MPLRKSFKKPTFSFGRIKKSKEGKSSASQPADAAENIAESRDDVVTVDAPTEPAVESHASVSNGSPKFLGRFKSLKRIKKLQKGASNNKASSSKPIVDSMNEVNDNIEGGGGIDAVVDVLEPEDAVKQEDTAELHDDTVKGDLEMKPSEESQHSAMSRVRSASSNLSGKKEEAAEEEAAKEEAAKEEAVEEEAAEEEAAEEEMPFAPEDSPVEGDRGVKEEVHAAKEEAHAESLDEVNSVESKKKTWMPSASAESDYSEMGTKCIEAVQQEGRVALGYFETQSIDEEDEDTSLLAQVSTVYSKFCILNSSPMPLLTQISFTTNSHHRSSNFPTLPPRCWSSIYPVSPRFKSGMRVSKNGNRMSCPRCWARQAMLRLRKRLQRRMIETTLMSMRIPPTEKFE